MTWISLPRLNQLFLLEVKRFITFEARSQETSGFALLVDERKHDVEVVSTRRVGCIVEFSPFQSLVATENRGSISTPKRSLGVPKGGPNTADLAIGSTLTTHPRQKKMDFYEEYFPVFCLDQSYRSPTSADQVESLGTFIFFIAKPNDHIAAHACISGAYASPRLIPSASIQTLYPSRIGLLSRRIRSAASRLAPIAVRRPLRIRSRVSVRSPHV